MLDLIKRIHDHKSKIDPLIVKNAKKNTKMNRLFTSSTEIKMERLARNNAEINTKIDQIKTKLKQHKLILDKVDAEINKMDAKIDKVDAKIDKIDSELNAKINKVDAKIDKVDAKIDKVYSELNAKIDSELNAKIDYLLREQNLRDAIEREWYIELFECKEQELPRDYSDMD